MEKKKLTLCVDIGGSRIKAIVVDPKGQPVTERVRLDTPRPALPDTILDVIQQLAQKSGKFDRVSVGFPGVVQSGIVKTAPNLDPSWAGFNIDAALEASLKKPVRAANDAAVQGLGAISGKGLEMVITLGTGLGSSLAEDGRLSTHLELAHHPLRKGGTYEEQLGNAAIEKSGKKKWNRRIKTAIEALRILTNFDHLYIGGGNARRVKFELPKDVSLVSNELGMRGGIWLWRERSPGSTDIFRKL